MQNYEKVNRKLTSNRNQKLININYMKVLLDRNFAKFYGQFLSQHGNITCVAYRRFPKTVISCSGYQRTCKSTENRMSKVSSESEAPDGRNTTIWRHCGGHTNCLADNLFILIKNSLKDCLQLSDNSSLCQCIALDRYSLLLLRNHGNACTLNLFTAFIHILRSQGSLTDVVGKIQG